MSNLLPFISRISLPRWSRHLLFWTGICLILMNNDVTRLAQPFHSSLAYTLSLLVPEILESYFLAYFLIPNYVLKGKYPFALLSFLVSSYLMGVIGRILFVYIAEPLVREGKFEQESVLEMLLDWQMLVNLYLPYMLGVVIMFLFIKYFIHFKNEQQKTLLMGKKKVEAELKTLKAQLNPHFLFNTLNNIYVLALDNSPKTAEAIGKLSEILDYILYRCNQQFVPLSSEIKLLENYIELEKLRYDDRLQVILKQELEYDGEIAPLILLSLVENAFKHGASEDSGSPKIEISLKHIDQEIIFTISNSIIHTVGPTNKETIGLNNIQKQLDLLYPNQHQLQFQEQAGYFTVTLHIRSLMD